MKTLRNLTLLSLVTLFFAACSDEAVEPRGPQADDTNNVTNDPEIFTSQIIGTNQKTWSLMAFNMDNETQTAACRFDDQLSFYDNGKFINNEGLTKCEEDERPYLSQGTWELVPEAKIIRFNQGGAIYELEVTKLNNNFLTAIGDWNGTKVSAEYTYDVVLNPPSGQQK